MLAAAVEFLDSKCMELVVKHLGYSRPIQPANFYLLVETSGSHEQHDKEVLGVMRCYKSLPCLQKLSDFIEHLSAEACIEDGTLASNLTKVTPGLDAYYNIMIIALGKSPLVHQRRNSFSFGT